MIFDGCGVQDTEPHPVLQNAKCKILCHCEGACARGNLQCTWLDRTKIEERLTPEIPTPVCALARNDTIWGLCGLMQNVKFRVILSERQRVEESPNLIHRKRSPFPKGEGISSSTASGLLLRCPAAAAPDKAGLRLADRCHSLRSLYPPPAALPSLPLPQRGRFKIWTRGRLLRPSRTQSHPLSYSLLGFTQTIPYPVSVLL